MKNLKVILFGLVFIFGSIEVSFADEFIDGLSADLDADISGAPGSELITKEKKTKSKERAAKSTDEAFALIKGFTKDKAYHKFENVHEQVKGYKKFIHKGTRKDLEYKIQRVSNASEYTSIVLTLQNSFNYCKAYKEVAITCCEKPDTCPGKNESIGKKKSELKEALPFLQQVAQYDGAVGGCLEGVLDISGGMYLISEQKYTCENLQQGAVYRTPANVKAKRKDHVGQRSGSVQLKGCQQICGDLIDVFVEAQEKGEAIHRTHIERSDSSSVVAIANREIAYANETQRAMQDVINMGRELGKISKQCTNKLVSKKQQADSNLGKALKVLSAGYMCYEAFKSGDGGGDPNKIVNNTENEQGCSNAFFRRENPSKCNDPNSYGGSGGYQKTSGIPTTAGNTTDDITPDDDPTEGGLNNGLGNGSQANQKTGGSGNGGLLPGNIGGGSGSGSSASNKAGRGRRGSRKAASLISGYGSSRGGSGSSGGGYGSGGGSGKWKSYFKKQKRKKGNKKSLAALAKMLKKVGISPDASGSIFERVSNRFSTSANKENMLDCKRNKTLWMQKR